MSTRVIEGNAPHMIAIEDRTEFRSSVIQFGAHVGDDSKVDVIVNDDTWIEIEREDWWRIIAHLSSQGFHSPTMAQQMTMERPTTVSWKRPERGIVVRSMMTEKLWIRGLVAVFRRLGHDIYVATDLVDGTTIYERGSKP